MHAIVSIDIGIKNLGWTIIGYDKSFVKSSKIDYKDLKVTFGIFNIQNRITKEDKDGGLVVKQCATVAEFFNKIGEVFIIDYIIIERQVPSNIKAMELMYSLTSIGVLYTDPSRVIIFDPKLKFTILLIPYKTASKAHKVQSIDHCARTLIALGNEELLYEFNNHDKRDDIADSFNQAFVWLVDNEKINITKTQLRSICIV